MSGTTWASIGTAWGNVWDNVWDNVGEYRDTLVQRVGQLEFWGGVKK